MKQPATITNDQAQETLRAIHHTAQKTHQALSAKESSPWLLLWGGLWMAAYTTCHFYLQHANLIFTVMGIVGGIGSGIIAWWSNTRGPLKTDSKNPVGRKIFWFWLALGCYVGIWLAFLSPFNGLQFNAMLVTAIMFAYIVMGLFYETPALTLIGIFVTLVTIVAYFAFPGHYCLWLAFCGGGTLLAAGIYMRLKWR